jgi:hypothetical protein
MTPSSNSSRSRADRNRAANKTQCAGTTRKGEPCRLPATPDSTTCIYHKPQDPEPNPRTVW